MSSPASISFDPRETRVLRGLARWMSLLGRFQVVGAVFVFVVLLAATGIGATLDLLGPAADAARDENLVTFGEVSRGTLAAVVAGVLGFSLLFLRGGMLLVSGAEELETVTNDHELGSDALEEAIRKLRSYFVLEAILMLAIASGVYAATIAGAS